MSAVDRERLTLTDADHPWVSVAVHRPSGAHCAAAPDPTLTPNPPVLLVPGAGGTLDDEGLVALAMLLAELGHLTVRANLPYREAGRRGAPRAEQEVDGYAAVLTAVSERVAPDSPWIIGGRSFGARVASLLVAQADPALLPVSGLLCLAYPLHPPHRPDRLRVAHWPTIGVPTLFLQGSRDPFCDLDLLARYTPTLAGPATVHAVRGADHQLRIAASVTGDGRIRPAARTIAGLRPVLAEWLHALSSPAD